jgi:hypothetical protein
MTTQERNKMIQWGLNRTSQTWQYRLIEANQPELLEALNAQHDEYKAFIAAEKKAIQDAKKAVNNQD